MTGMDKNLKKIYDVASTTISRLHFKQASLNQEEMYFLLSLLDRVIQGRSSGDFLNCLRQWQTGDCDQEIDEIIKASILPLDLDDDEAVQNVCALILELINYKNDGEND